MLETSLTCAGGLMGELLMCPILKSWNHGMGGVGKDLKNHLVPPPWSGQGHLPLGQVAPSYKSSWAVHLLTDTLSMSSWVRHALNSLPCFDNDFYLSRFWLLLSTLFNHALNMKDLLPRVCFRRIPLAASCNIRC